VGCATTPPLQRRSWSENNACPAWRLAVKEAPAGDTWISLLLQGYDAGTRRATSPAVDCSGARVVWEAPAQACADGEVARKELAAGAIAAGDVLSFPAGPEQWLVWVITARYASGDALGVVALVEAQLEPPVNQAEREKREKRLVVRGLGALRAYPSKVRLRLQEMGMEELLVAEGERCGVGGGCSSVVRVVPLKGERFVPEAVRGENGECVEAAQFFLKQQETIRVGESVRRMEGEASVVYEERSIRVEESVLVQEAGRKADAPPQLLHRAHDTRVIVVEGGRLKGAAPSLWTRMAKDARER